ncbi:MAG: apolipoprotein N-acyltransferase [Deltaproteobacteria bacterium]|nr:apolipoprotein N-acyltransferase [Deltaproteobacteria bacterium]MBW1992816.1 apolipoprotein N-acyltransferase [Deltaproteobacteria bacterium]MBW2153128.1 apolipoprotein N-acyltransferase [Deltaproteobacteria bacterium]
MPVLSGVLLTAAFPNMGISWLVWFALVPLLISISDQSPGKSFRIGFLCGIVHYLSLMYWLAYTMHTYGHLPWFLSIPVLFLLTCYLSLYTGAFSASVILLCKKPTGLFFIIPVLWVFFEYLRTVLLSGLPWELIGYSQHKILPIIQISDLFGVYGVSFLIALSNATLFLVFLSATGKHWNGFSVSKPITTASVLLFACAFLAGWLYGTRRIASVERLMTSAPKVRVAVVQGNIDQGIKWNPDFQDSSVEKYLRLSRTAGRNQVDLIVWPETATPFYFLHDAELTRKVFEGIFSIGADFLIGSPSYTQQKNRIAYYNSAYLLRADGKIYGKYNKVHLVPFGEYVPFKKWLPFLGKMVSQVGDFKSGKLGQTIPWRAHRVGLLICFEIIFPGLSRAVVKNQAALLVNITNDAWFGKTSAPYQHFSMAVFRAVENRRSLVRSANTGISGFVDPIGRALDVTALFKDEIRIRSVPLMKASTFYTRFGNLFAFACLAATVVVTAIRVMTKGRS